MNLVKLTAIDEQFAQLIFKGVVKKDAYLKLHPECAGLSNSVISSRCNKLMNQPKVAARINQLRAEQVKPLVFGQQEVLKRLIDLSLVDPNEIMELRRENCRHCNGKKFAYQWADKAEFAAAVVAVMDNNAKLPEGVKRKELPTDEGGYGFMRTGDVHPDCPQCSGLGFERVHLKDTRHLSPAARALYAGVKQTQHGIEVKTHDQFAALMAVAKTFGMLGSDGVNIVVNNNATVIPEGALPTNAQDAAKMYQTIMQGQKLVKGKKRK